MDVSGLYWRKSALSAAQCPPGLLSLAENRLSFTTSDAKVFETDAAAVSGSLTGWGSLALDIDGHRFVFMASAGQLAQQFSLTQKQVISAATRNSSLRSITDWPALLTAAGATVTTPRFQTRRILGYAVLAIAVASIVATFVARGGF